MPVRRHQFEWPLLESSHPEAREVRFYLCGLSISIPADQWLPPARPAGGDAHNSSSSCFSSPRLLSGLQQERLASGAATLLDCPLCAHENSTFARLYISRTPSASRSFREPMVFCWPANFAQVGVAVFAIFAHHQA